jgi:hypothetical protein
VAAVVGSAAVACPCGGLRAVVAVSPALRFPLQRGEANKRLQQTGHATTGLSCFSAIPA